MPNHRQLRLGCSGISPTRQRPPGADRGGLWARPSILPDGANPRFVVTSLGREKIDARGLYEDLYCARGEMENRIKE